MQSYHQVITVSRYIFKKAKGIVQKIAYDMPPFFRYAKGFFPVPFQVVLIEPEFMPFGRKDVSVRKR